MFPAVGQGKVSTAAPASRSTWAARSAQRSTAALSVLGDSHSTSADSVSSAHGARDSQNVSNCRIIVVMMRRVALVSCLLASAGGAGSFGQGQPPAQRPVMRPAPPPATTPGQPGVQEPPPASKPPAAPGEPSEATLGLPVYPSSQFLTSYDAGQGQRFYLYGSTASFAEVVAYYRSVLKQRGELVFDQPATHMFEVGRFREESMGFPPGITVKDYTWGGMAGYPNAKPGAKPSRFPTVIQVVPAPPGTTDSRR